MLPSVLQYSVTEVWSVPYEGTVVNGIMNAGHVNAGDAIFLGPDENGTHRNTRVASKLEKIIRKLAHFCYQEHSTETVGDK